MSILSLYFLAFNHPIKAMYLGVKFLFVLTPSPCGHSPYILLRKTQGESVQCISLSPLLRCYSKCPVALRGVALAIGEVSRSDGGIENAIVSVCLYRIYSFLP